jgi:hypothetical protein
MSRGPKIGLAALIAASTAAAILVGTHLFGSEAVDRRATPSGVLARFASGDGWTYRDSLVLRTNGKATLVYDRRITDDGGTRRFRLTAAEAGRVRQLLETADLDSLHSSYTGSGADYASYTVTQGDVTVVADEQAIEDGEVPVGLVHAIRFLDGIITERVSR